jgi:hypothetical protein
MTNAGDVTAICAVATLAFTILCAVIKAIVDSSVNKAMQEQNKWLGKEFGKIREWQVAHVRDGHNGPRRPPR